MKREADRAGIDAVLAAIGECTIIEISTRDPWWGARSVANRYEGRNVLGRLWMELRHQLREADPAAGSGAWTGRIRVGCLAGAIGVLDAVPAAPCPIPRLPRAKPVDPAAFDSYAQPIESVDPFHVP